MNAMKHGERSAANVAARRELAQVLRIFEHRYRQQAPTVPDVAQQSIWLGHIARELAGTDYTLFHKG
jgi:hypothetical protein